MNDLVPKDEADLEKRREAQIQRLRSLRESLPARVRDEPEKVIMDLYRTEALSGIALKLKIGEVVREAKLTTIEMKRQMAIRYSPGKGSKAHPITLESLGVADATAVKWRKLGKLPAKHYNRVVLRPFLTESVVIGEYNRLIAIKQVLETMEKTINSPREVIDEFMKRGLTIGEVRKELGLVKDEAVYDVEDLDTEDEDDIDYDTDEMAQIRTFVVNGNHVLKMVEDLKIIIAPMEMTTEIIDLLRAGTEKFIGATKQMKAIYRQAKEDL